MMSTQHPDTQATEMGWIRGPPPIEKTVDGDMHATDAQTSLTCAAQSSGSALYQATLLSSSITY